MTFLVTELQTKCLKMCHCPVQSMRCAVHIAFCILTLEYINLNNQQNKGKLVVFSLAVMLKMHLIRNAIFQEKEPIALTISL